MSDVELSSVCRKIAFRWGPRGFVHLLNWIVSLFFAEGSSDYSFDEEYAHSDRGCSEVRS